MNDKFIKLGKYVINIEQITSIEIYAGGGSKVNLSKEDSVRLEKADTDSLLSVLSPLGE